MALGRFGRSIGSLAVGLGLSGAGNLPEAFADEKPDPTTQVTPEDEAAVMRTAHWVRPETEEDTAHQDDAQPDVRIIRRVRRDAGGVFDFAIVYAKPGSGSGETAQFDVICPAGTGATVDLKLPNGKPLSSDGEPLKTAGKNWKLLDPEKQQVAVTGGPGEKNNYSITVFLPKKPKNAFWQANTRCAKINDITQREGNVQLAVITSDNPDADYQKALAKNPADLKRAKEDTAKKAVRGIFKERTGSVGLVDNAINRTVPRPLLQIAYEAADLATSDTINKTLPPLLEEIKKKIVLKTVERVLPAGASDALRQQLIVKGNRIMEKLFSAPPIGLIDPEAYRKPIHDEAAEKANVQAEKDVQKPVYDATNRAAHDAAEKAALESVNDPALELDPTDPGFYNDLEKTARAKAREKATIAAEKAARVKVEAIARRYADIGANHGAQAVAAAKIQAVLHAKVEALQNAFEMEFVEINPMVEAEIRRLAEEDAAKKAAARKAQHRAWDANVMPAGFVANFRDGKPTYNYHLSVDAAVDVHESTNGKNAIQAGASLHLFHGQERVGTADDVAATTAVGITGDVRYDRKIPLDQNGQYSLHLAPGIAVGAEYALPATVEGKGKVPGEIDLVAAAQMSVSADLKSFLIGLRAEGSVALDPTTWHYAGIKAGLGLFGGKRF